MFVFEYICRFNSKTWSKFIAVGLNHTRYLLISFDRNVGKLEIENMQVFCTTGELGKILL